MKNISAELDDEEPYMSRRKLLSSIGAGSLAYSAGCLEPKEWTCKFRTSLQEEESTLYKDHDITYELEAETVSSEGLELNVVAYFDSEEKDTADLGTYSLEPGGKIEPSSEIKIGYVGETSDGEADICVNTSLSGQKPEVNN